MPTPTRQRASWRRWNRSWGLICALGLSARAAVAEEIPSALVWSAPSEARVIEWPDATPPGQDVDPERLTQLKPGQVYLVPVEPGGHIKVEGAHLSVGLASGLALLPDTVTWYSGVPPSGIVRIPSYTSARFVALTPRNTEVATARVRVATPRSEPMAWYRLDEAMWRWIEGGGVPSASELAGCAAGDLFRFLDAMRVALKPLPPETQKALLRARWLDESERRRPMAGPFFTTSHVVASGGRQLPSGPRRQSYEQRRLVTSGETLRLTPRHPGVVSVLVRTKGSRRARVRILEGDALLRDVVVTPPQRVKGQVAWTSPRFVRAIASSAVPVRVQVLEGTALVTAWSYSRRPRTLHREHSLEQWLRQAETSASGRYRKVAVTLARAARTRSAADARALTELASEPNVPAPMRALLLHDRLRHPGSVEDDVRIVTRLWQLTQPLADGLKAPFRRSMLEETLLAHGDRLDPAPDLSPAPASPSQPSTGLSDDFAAVHVLAAIAAPPRDRRRPYIAAQAEDYAELAPDLAAAARLVRRSWLRSAPWAAVALPEAAHIETTLEIPRPELGEALCSIETPSGLRWSRIDSSHRLHVTPTSGTHARVALRAESPEPERDSLLLVDETPIAVHTGALLGSTVAIAPGERQFTLRSGVPLLARLPRQGKAACDSLREIHRWVVLNEPTEYALPAAPGWTVAGIVVAPQSVRAGGARLTLEAGANRYEAWVRGTATGTIEIPVGVQTNQLVVRSTEPLWIRALLRLHRPPQEARHVRTRRPKGQQLTETQLLERIRSATRALRQATSETARDAALEQRATSLEQLRYHSLAAVDRIRMSTPTLSRPADTQATAPGSLTLPAASPPVVPLGLLPRIPPLPMPRDRTSLRQALAARRRGRSPRDIAVALLPTAGRSNGVDALLLAVSAQAAGMLEAAAGAYERIGRGAQSGDALARAAALRVDIASASADLDETMIAYQRAREALALGGQPGGTFGRLAESIRWTGAPVISGANRVLVEYLRSPAEDSSLAVRVRRALTDAPPTALVSTGASMRIGLSRVPSSRVALELVCHSLEGPNEPCRSNVYVDGMLTLCGRRSEDEEWLEGRVARAQECELDLPEGARYIDVRPPENQELIAWVRPRALVDDEALPINTVAYWHETVPTDTLKIPVLAPTVLRLKLRAYAGAPADLDAEVRLPDGKTLTRESWHSDGTADPGAQVLSPARPLGEERTHHLIVTGTGPRIVALRARGNRVVMRVEAAAAERKPEPKLPEEDAARTLVARRSSAPPDWFVVRRSISEEPQQGPFVLGVSLAYVDRNLSDTDLDSPDRFGELGVHARRQFIASSLWGSASLLSRYHRSAPSQGGEARLSLAPGRAAPGAFATTRVITQRFDDQWTVGMRASLGTLASIRLADAASLLPGASLTFRKVDPSARNQPGVDRDVYSNYGETRPRSVDAWLDVVHRPYVDLLTRYGVAARLSPDLDGLDRVDVGAAGNWLAGAGMWPWLGFDATVSVRPISPQRSDAFVRFTLSPSARLWRWLTADHQVYLDGRLTYYVDVGSDRGRPSQLTGWVALGYDFLWGRDLNDDRVTQRPFRERLEEGRGIAQPQRVPTDPYWREAEQ